MVVGGKGSENLAEALAALEESRKETRDLKLVVENMARKTDIIENQLSQLMLVYQASQKIQDNQQQQQQRSEEGMEGIPTIQVHYNFFIHE
jgi:phage-related minor tail protein